MLLNIALVSAVMTGTTVLHAGGMMTAFRFAFGPARRTISPKALKVSMVVLLMFVVTIL